MKWLLHLALDVLDDACRESHEPVNEGWLDVPGPFRQGSDVGLPGEHSKKKRQWKVLLAIMGQIEQRKVEEANA